MLGGFSQVDPTHPVWVDVLEIPNITRVKLCALREKFLPKGMEGVMTEEARNERERKPEDGLEIHEEGGIKAGTVLSIKGKLNSHEFKFTFVTSQPQRMWPTQDMNTGRVRVNNPRMQILENFKPTCISTDVSFSWAVGRVIIWKNKLRIGATIFVFEVRDLVFVGPEGGI